MTTSNHIRILKADETYASNRQTDDAADQLNGWFDRLMVQSGLESSPVALLMLSIVSAIGFGGAAGPRRGVCRMRWARCVRRPFGSWG